MVVEFGQGVQAQDSKVMGVWSRGLEKCDVAYGVRKYISFCEV